MLLFYFISKLDDKFEGERGFLPLTPQYGIKIQP